MARIGDDLEWQVMRGLWIGMFAFPCAMIGAGMVFAQCMDMRRYEACISHHSPKECADGNSK